jgi:hypothetical protein
MRKLLFTIILISWIISPYVFPQGPEEFKPSGKVLMETFGDYYYKFGSDTAPSGSAEYQNLKKDQNGFALRRIYLGYNYIFTEKISSTVMLESNDGLILADGKRAFTLKLAYFEWKDIFPGSKLIVGAQKTSIFEGAEKIWGLRYVEKTIVDFRGIGKSNDVGIALTGNFDKNEIFGYHVMVANGESQKAETNKYKKVYGTLSGNFVDKKLLVEFHGNYEKTSDNTYNLLTKATLGFINDYISVGVEELLYINHNDKTNPINSGSSLFARVSFIKDKFAGFARVDTYYPDIENGANVNNDLFTVLGIEYKPIKQLSILPNLWMMGYNSDRLPDIIGRVTFRFKI